MKTKKRPKTETPRDTMTTEDAAKYLGVRTKTIGYLHWKFLNPEKAREDQVPVWMPEPVEGSKWTESGVYNTEDIQELDTVLDVTPTLVRRRPKRRRNKK